MDIVKTARPVFLFLYLPLLSPWSDTIEQQTSGFPEYQWNFLKQGVPDWLVDELKQKPPKQFIPTHLFQVLHVGVGRASGAVPYNLESINNCMIRWGKVEKILDDTAVINLNSLEKLSDKYKLVTLKRTVPFNPFLVPELKTGSVASVHWNQLIKVLTPKEEKNIAYWTEAVLTANFS